MVGTFLPDVLDKSLMLVGASPCGRSVGHSLVFWGTATLLFIILYAVRHPRESTVWALVVGGWGHLVVDAVDDLFAGFEHSGYAFSAWAGWPWTNPDMWSWRVAPLLPTEGQPTTSLELAVLLVCTAVLVRARPQ